MASALGRRLSVRCLVCTLMLLPMAAVAPAAQATFPGRSDVIAFSRAESDPEDEGLHAPLWSVDPRTREERRLTAVPRRCRRLEDWWDAEPSSSPSGRRIVYVHYDDCGRGLRWGIYVIRADGSHRRLLIRVRRGDLWLQAPVFSPNGRRIAFTRTFFYDLDGDGIRDKTDAVYTASARPQGRPRRTLVRASVGSQFGPIEKLSWGPARAVALNTDGRLTIVRPGRRGRRRLINGRAPDWSPSASALAFQRYEGPNTSNIFTVRRSGRRLRRVTSSGNAVNPIWSPGSSQIAFIDPARETLNTISLKNRRRKVLARNIQWTGGLAWQARPRRRVVMGSDPARTMLHARGTR
jgi:Tol biopolymer transport system component